MSERCVYCAGRLIPGDDIIANAMGEWAHGLCRHRANDLQIAREKIAELEAENGQMRLDISQFVDAGRMALWILGENSYGRGIADACKKLQIFEEYVNRE